VARRLVLIHGFTQNANCWPGIAAPLGEAGHEVVAVDAPGHGRRSQMGADLWGASDLIAAEGGRAAYLGYSMGGRIALHVALAHPEVVDQLILVSATPGIEDDTARSERRAADDAQATALERDGDVAAFLDRWLAGPLFASLPRDRAGLDARLTNTAAGLASSLRGAGTGTQDNLWPRLGQLTMPVLIVAGAADGKYAAIAERMATAMPHAQLALIPAAGHAAHLEQPAAFVGLVLRFLASTG
jgi:2-succinyl-6-hydroxy-2,4-cyclohexadiene-1-carboxylate synthase